MSEQDKLVAWRAPDGQLREDEGQGEPPFNDWTPLYERPAPPAPELPALPEPVAWRSFDVARQKAYYDEVPITSIQPGAYTHTPLYAAPPPARVPVLTDEQIDAIGIKMLGKGYGGNTDREFARAVLAAATQGSKP